jgi:hypothetical protein
LASYDKSSVDRLLEGVAYELWLIEEAYRVTDKRLAVEDVDELIYPPAGGMPAVTIYGMLGIDEGDWRPGFLRVGAPLILVTCFKLIDMVVEWMMQENGLRVSFRFKEKIKDIDKLSTYPVLFNERPWLLERLFGLYTTLEPVRGAIIHCRIGAGEGGNLSIPIEANGSSSTVEISASDLENLARIVVSIYHYLDGTWTMDLFREKRLSNRLDNVAGLHGLSSLGQLEPGFLNIRVYAREGEDVTIDLRRLRADVRAKRPNQDVMFDIRIVAVPRGGIQARAYLCPWDYHKDKPEMLTLRPDAYQKIPAPLPENIDLAVISRQLDDLLK